MCRGSTGGRYSIEIAADAQQNTYTCAVVIFVTDMCDRMFKKNFYDVKLDLTKLQGNVLMS